MSMTSCARTIAYKMQYSVLEFVFGLIGPAVIVVSLVYPISDMRIGSLWLHLKPGMANGILGGFGLFLSFLTCSTLFKKRAANAQGACIVLGEKDMTFTAVKGYRGVLATMSYMAIEKVVTAHSPETDTSAEERTVTVYSSSMWPRRYEFDACHMVTDSDFDVLVHTLKHRAVNAVFEGR